MNGVVLFAGWHQLSSHEKELHSLASESATECHHSLWVNALWTGRAGRGQIPATGTRLTARNLAWGCAARRGSYSALSAGISSG
jgi:hypothetical protein